MSVTLEMLPSYAASAVEMLLQRLKKKSTEVDILEIAAICFDAPLLDFGNVLVDKTVWHMMDSSKMAESLILPFWKEGNHIHCLVSRPWDLSINDRISELSPNFQAVLYTVPSDVLSSEIQKLVLARASGDGRDKGGQGEGKVSEVIELVVSDKDAFGLVSKILLRAMAEKASDLHLCPKGDKGVARAEINGLIVDLEEMALDDLLSIQLVLMGRTGGVMSQERMMYAQDGGVSVKVTGGKVIDLRLACVPVYAPAYPNALLAHMTVRFQDRERLRSVNLDSIFSGDTLELLKRTLMVPGGLCIVTGPTGSGKTTTLGACIKFVHDPLHTTYTIEDPVENELPGISSILVKKKFLSFAQALKALLRMKPHNILVGEMRDEEAAEVVMEAAETGHRVLTTVHADYPEDVPIRLNGLKMPGYRIAGKLQLCSSQRLIPLLCERCSKPVRLTAAQVRNYGMDEGFVGAEVREKNPDGCASCKQGVAGRKPIISILVLNEELRSLISREDWEEFKKAARAEIGNKSLRHQAATMVLSGQADIRSVADCVSLNNLKREDFPMPALPPAEANRAG